jgi:hypothetical protein
MFMMLLSTLLLISAQQPAQATSSPQQVGRETATNTSQSTQKAGKANSGPAALDKCWETGTDQSESVDQSSEDNISRRSELISAYATLAMAIFTAVTIGVFAFQVRTAHDVERAWIAVASNNYPDVLNHPQALDGSGLYIFKFKNHGRTPARLSSSKARFHLINKIGELPTVPDYGDQQSTISNPIPQDGRIIVPGEEFTVAADFEGTEEKPGLSAIDTRAWRDGNLKLVCYGCIKYRDAFARNHQTRFCYVVHSYGGFPGFKDDVYTWAAVGGPPEYNKAT